MTIIVNKSTVPIGTGDWVGNILRRTAAPKASFAVVSNPEFLAAAICERLGADVRLVAKGMGYAAIGAQRTCRLTRRTSNTLVGSRKEERAKSATVH